MSENFDDDDSVCKSSDFFHEIKDSELKNKLSDKYWEGILVGMFVSTMSLLIGIGVLLLK